MMFRTINSGLEELTDYDLLLDWYRKFEEANYDAKNSMMCK